ncbi:MAG: universal stress protein [Rubrimonas sp.]|uniref:universal stress protein n=1 Tax=Rubrimonas sp. TaxID=2036015 RepID=UPI002FDDCB98
MPRLFAATDLSERSRIAEARAALVAHRKGWTLDLVHALDDEEPEAVLAAHRRAAEATLAHRAVELSLATGAEIAARIVLGDPAEALAAEAIAEGAAAVVVGPHRRRLIRDIFEGTTAERVIRAAAVPVLSVHTAPEGGYRRMLLALDGSPASAAALAAVRALGLTAPSDVVALAVADAPELSMLRRGGARPAEIDAAAAEARRGALDALSAVLPRGGFPCGREAVFDTERTVAEAICAAADRLGCDLIALGTRGLGSVEGLLLGSVASAVLACSRIDVLVAPPKA